MSSSVHSHDQWLINCFTDAGELMHMEGPTTFQQCTTFHTGVLSSVQHHLKKNHFHAFDALLDALQHRDVVGRTCMGRETLVNGCMVLFATLGGYRSRSS